MRTQPTLEAFEAELRKYNALEQEIAAIPTLHNIGELGAEGHAAGLSRGLRPPAPGLRVLVLAAWLRALKKFSLRAVCMRPLTPTPWFLEVDLANQF